MGEEKRKEKRQRGCCIRESSIGGISGTGKARGRGERTVDVRFIRRDRRGCMAWAWETARAMELTQSEMT